MMLPWGDTPPGLWFYGISVMSEINLLEAFARYKVKSPTRARSAMTDDRALVLSCFYERFRRAGAGVLRYEEDLAGDEGAAATALRGHLSEALKAELDVRLIVVMPVQRPPSVETFTATPRPNRVTCHARKDLVGRVTFFDGGRFIVEFRKAEAVA
jgi:hypothetical protein